MEDIRDTSILTLPGSLFEERVSDIWTLEGGKMIIHSPFCKRFLNLPKDSVLFSSLIWYLWRNNPKGIIIDAELIKWGFTQVQKDFAQMIINYPDEYEEFLEQVYNILDRMTKAYYSGFIRKNVG